MNKKHIIMIIAIIFIVIMPLMLFQGKGEDEGYFGGADGAAADAITESGYQPWFKPIWEPPSGEIESLLFATQAAIGAGIIGYFLGYYQMKRKMESK